MKAALENEYYSTLESLVEAFAGQTISVDQACENEEAAWSRLCLHHAHQFNIEELDVNDLDRLAAIYARHGVYIA